MNRLKCILIYTALISLGIILGAWLGRSFLFGPTNIEIANSRIIETRNAIASLEIEQKSMINELAAQNVQLQELDIKVESEEQKTRGYYDQQDQANYQSNKERLEGERRWSQLSEEQKAIELNWRQMILEKEAKRLGNIVIPF